MKNLLRILIVATFLGIVYYYSVVSDDEVAPLHGPNASNLATPQRELGEKNSLAQQRPASGFSTYIGKNKDELIAEFGVPTRIDKSNYKYEWWIYLNDASYTMFSVANDKINQVYTNSINNDVSPYAIGQSLDDIYRMTIIEAEVTVPINDNIYMLTMAEFDMRTRILVAFDGVYAQLYIDEVEEKLVGIRYMDSETLVLHQPYELQYFGEAIQKDIPSSFDQVEIDYAYATQLFDLVNIFRGKNNLQKLIKNDALDNVAKLHSEDMFFENYLSHDSPNNGSLEERLTNHQIEFKKSEENLALAYYDAIEAVHGWMNSDAHRSNILDRRFNFIGSGVYMNSYTQIFVEKELINNIN